MLLDKTTVLEHAKIYAQLVGERFRPIRIMLWGSYANGNYNKNSDIDIAMIINKIGGDIETGITLYRN